MKTEIHPDYIDCRVTCSCGNQFTTRATVPELRVELCAECHPFYTGKQKLVDTGGRVERFQKRYAKAQAGEPEAETAEKKTKRKKRAGEAPKRKPPVATPKGPRPSFERKPRGERGDERRSEARERDDAAAAKGGEQPETPDADAGADTPAESSE